MFYLKRETIQVKKQSKQRQSIGQVEVLALETMHHMRGIDK